MRNLFLCLALVHTVACNNAPFSMSSAEQKTGNVVSSKSSAEANKIRFRFGLRNFREINEIMHSKSYVASQNKHVHGNKATASAVTSCKKKKNVGTPS